MPVPVLPTAIDPAGEAFRANREGMLGLLGEIGGLLQQASLGGGERAIAGYRIKATMGWISLGLGELWHYRELMYFRTWRDIKARYKQTVVGAAWAVLQPLLTMLIFSLFFGRLAKIT